MDQFGHFLCIQNIISDLGQTEEAVLTTKIVKTNKQNSEENSVYPISRFSVLKSYKSINLDMYFSF